MRKLTLLLLLLSTLAVLQVKGQTGTSCLNPKTMTLTAGQSTGWRATDHDSLWITFVADTTIQNYVISAKLNYKKQIVGVYQKYSCNINDNLINAVHPNDSTFYVSYTNLVIGQSYKLLLISVTDTACKTCPDTLVNGNSKSVGMIERNLISNCPNALFVSANYSQSNNSINGQKWFSFVPDSVHEIIEARTISNVRVLKIDLYTGTCNSFSLIATDTVISNLDNDVALELNNFDVNNTYFIKVTTENNNELPFHLDISSEILIDDELCVTNLATSVVCCIDDDGPDLFFPTCSGTITACVGEELSITYGGDWLAPVDVYLNGTLIYTGFPINNTAMLYTPLTAGVYYFKQSLVGYYGITVIVGSSSTLPQYTFNPASPICLGTCVQFSSLNSNVINYDFSSSDSYIGCPSGGPGNTYPNAFNFNNAGINTVNYTINAGHTCSATVTQTIEVIDPKLTIQQLGDLCSLTHTFIATVNCNQSTNFTWNVYNGTSNSGTLIYSQSSATNLVYTFPSAGTYYVEASTTPNAFGMNTVSGNIITIGAPANNLSFSYNSIDCTKLSSCFTTNANCVLPNTTWLWTMDGNPVSTQQNPCLTFPSIGSHTVCVTQNNNTFGNTNPNLIVTNCQVINVTGAPVVVITNTLTSICSAPNGLATFTATNTTGGATPLWLWNATDAITGAAIAINPTVVNNMATYNFTSLANYPNPITICVTAINGCAATSCFTILPCCPAPTGVVKYNNYTFTGTTNLSNPNGYVFSGVITIAPSAQLNINLTHISFNPNTKIILSTKSGLTIKASSLGACSAMWDGIYLGAQSKLRIAQTVIEDAKRAIVDSINLPISNNSIDLDDVWFNKNRIGIEFKAPATTSALQMKRLIFSTDNIPAIYTTGAITGAISPVITPAVLNTYTAAKLKAPYTTIYGQYGIFLNKTKQGGTTKIPITRIVCDKVYQGVYSYLSKAEITNSAFQNHNATLHGAYPGGVYVEGSNTTSLSNLSDVIIGSTNLANKCTFTNIQYGVRNTGSSNFSVLRNVFNKNDIAVVVATNSKGKQVTVDRNKIYDTERGIFLLINSWVKADITENRMENTTFAVGTNATNYGIYAGEFTYGTGSAFANYTIYNNYIDGYYNGIYAGGTFSTQIVNNETHIREDNTSGNFQMGIRFENTSTILISNNLVDKLLPNNSAWWQFGIFAENNIIPVVSCNSINNFYASLKFQLHNYTTPGTGIIANVMNHAYHGIWLDANAEIGDQNLGLSFNSDNQWSNIAFAQTYVSGNSNQTSVLGNTTPSKMFTKNSLGGAYYLNNTLGAKKDISSTLGLQLYGVYSNSSLFGGINCFNNIPTPLLKIMQGATNIAANNLTFGINQSNLSLMSQRNLRKNLKTENINLNLSSNVVFKNFVSTSNATSVGKLFMVDSLIHTAISDDNAALFSAAQSVNSSVANTCMIEQNHKWINDLFIGMQSNPLDSLQLFMLEQLAIKCPQFDGEAVHQARSILMSITHKSYVSYCDQDNIQIHPSGARLSQISPVDSISDTGIALYPNPAANNITIKYVKASETENLELYIYNMIGELMLSKLLMSEQSIIDLDDFRSGVYMYQIKKGTETLKSNKLIIAK